MELGRTYAALKPTLASDTATTTTPDFLDSLWRAQLPSDPSIPKPYPEIRAELQRGMTALDSLLDGVEDPLGALRFINNLVQAVTNIESLSDDAVLDAQFLRELVAFGFEVARLNPSVTVSDSGGIEQWLSILWSGEGDLRQAQGGLAQLFDQLSSPLQLEPLTLQDQLERLKFSTQLVKTVQLVDDSDVKPLSQSLDHLGYLLDLGSSYAVLKPAGAKADATEASFLTLVAQGDLQAAANELEKLIQQALDTIQYTEEVTVTTVITDEGEKVLVGRTPLSNGIVTPLGFNLRDDDPSNDRYPIAYQVQRADGTIEPPVPGDTLFRVYLNQGDVTGLQPGEVALYPGDVVLYPTQSEDPFGSDRLRNLASGDYSPVDKVLDAIRLAPYMAGPEIVGQINGFVQTVKDHPFLTSLALGGIVGAQFLQPVGLILDVGLILIGGWQAGFSLGSFFYKAATAESQSELWDASRELVNFFTTLATTVPFGGLTKLEPSDGLLNTTRLLDAAQRLW
ncbi:MAG: hypothetical protein IGS54_20910 [Elainella sp. C42_A2020_010]|nr:hypothetical protein [Elainella sp. C42_A2020_010]